MHPSPHRLQPYIGDSSISEELGLIVQPLFQDKDGSLKESLLRPKSFDDFKRFIIAQAGLDQKAFRSPYVALLSQSRYEILLKEAYVSVNSAKSNGDWHAVKVGVSNAGNLSASIRRFEEELIRIDPERYVSHALGSKEGRVRLEAVFSRLSYSKETFHALIVALKSVGSRKLGDDKVSKMDSAVSWLENYSDSLVDDAELKEGIDGALDFLKAYEAKEDCAGEQDKRLTTAKSVEYRSLRSQTFPDPLVNDLKNKLIDFWMMAADDKMWVKSGLPSGEQDWFRDYLLEKTSVLIDNSGSIRSDSGLKIFMEMNFTPFMEGAADDSTVEHFIFGSGLEDYLSDMPDGYKEAYLALKTFHEEIKTSYDMGVVVIAGDHRRRSNPLFADIINQLQTARRQLWVGYKQHGALSRGLTQLAEAMGADNDIRQIRQADDFMGGLIADLEKGESLETVTVRLYRSMQEDGVIMIALRDAASNEGLEQCLNTLQFLAEGLVLGLATGGAAMAAKAAQMGKWAHAMRAARSGYQSAKIGAINSGIEVLTGGYREGPETALAWGKDAFATGLSSTLTGAVPFITPAMNGGLLRRFAGRYVPSSAKGSVLTTSFHAAGDMGLEVIEEGLDQMTRQVLDGTTRGLSLTQLENTAFNATMGGGFTKVGMIREMVKEAKGNPEAALAANPVIANVAESLVTPTGLFDPYRRRAYSSNRPYNETVLVEAVEGYLEATDQMGILISDETYDLLLSKEINPERTPTFGEMADFESPTARYDGILREIAYPLSGTPTYTWSGRRGEVWDFLEKYFQQKGTPPRQVLVIGGGLVPSNPPSTAEAFEIAQVLYRNAPVSMGGAVTVFDLLDSIVEAANRNKGVSLPVVKDDLDGRKNKWSARYFKDKFPAALTTTDEEGCVQIPIPPSISEKVRGKKGNIVTSIYDRVTERPDVISICAVLQYFSVPQQKRVLIELFDFLLPGGVLVLAEVNPFSLKTLQEMGIKSYHYIGHGKDGMTIHTIYVKEEDSNSNLRRLSATIRSDKVRAAEEYEGWREEQKEMLLSAKSWAWKFKKLDIYPQSPLSGLDFDPDRIKKEVAGAFSAFDPAKTQAVVDNANPEALLGIHLFIPKTAYFLNELYEYMMEQKGEGGTPS